MKILYLIPARGGSKGLPGKNIKKLNAKPLIAYSIEVAQQLTENKFICVSTDCIDIVKVAESYNVRPPFQRPAELATDTAGTYEVVMHALHEYESRGLIFDAVMLLQPTSPFREKKHLTDVIDLLQKNPDAEMIVSVRESKENPYFNLFEEDSTGHLKKSKTGNFTRRQDCPVVYAFNGSIYLMRVQALKSIPIHQFQSIVKYIMSDEYSIDIDTLKDWMLAEQSIESITKSSITISHENS